VYGASVGTNCSQKSANKVDCLAGLKSKLPGLSGLDVVSGF
jgi:hypothetical protein